MSGICDFKEGGLDLQLQRETQIIPHQELEAIRVSLPNVGYVGRRNAIPGAKDEVTEKFCADLGFR
jgi:hypothetical protein